MRLFVGLALPPELVDELDGFLDPRRDVEGPRWIPAQNWHVTLAFLGQVAEYAVEELSEALAGCAEGQPPLRLAVDQPVAFPDAARAKVLALRVGGPDTDPLRALASRVRVRTTRAGAPPRGHPFSPHLSLARWSRPVDAVRWLRVLDSFGVRNWTADTLHLVSSEQGSGIRRYRDLDSWPLAGTAAPGPRAAR